jgi:hypothetical protein
MSIKTYLEKDQIPLGYRRWSARICPTWPFRHSNGGYGDNTDSIIITRAKKLLSWFNTVSVSQIATMSR